MVLSMKSVLLPVETLMGIGQSAAAGETASAAARYEYKRMICFGRWRESQRASSRTRSKKCQKEIQSAARCLSHRQTKNKLLPSNLMHS